MMEKRNFVTSARTPGGVSASDMDDIIDAASPSFGRRKTLVKSAQAYEKKASAEDEKSDRMM